MFRRIHPIPLVYLSLTLLMHSLSIYSCTICIFCTFKGKHWVFSFVESVLVDISLYYCVVARNSTKYLFKWSTIYVFTEFFFTTTKKIMANELWDIFNPKISKKYGLNFKIQAFTNFQFIFALFLIKKIPLWCI